MDNESAVKCENFQYSSHAVKRMLEKQITTFEVQQTAELGEVIQQYEDDKPFPSELILNFIASRPIHVVFAQNKSIKECIIITCYVPSEMIWNNDFKTKR